MKIFLQLAEIKFSYLSCVLNVCSQPISRSYFNNLRLLYKIIQSSMGAVTGQVTVVYRACYWPQLESEKMSLALVRC